MAYRHYIMVDEHNRIIDGWSSGEKPGIGPTQGCILLTDDGDLEFPYALLQIDGIYQYKYENNQVIKRTTEEKEADRPKEVDPEPSEMERLRADVDYILIMEGLV